LGTGELLTLLPLLDDLSSLYSPEDVLAFRDFANVRFLKLLLKLLPSVGPPATGGKTPIGKDIFRQLKAYLSVDNDV
jgi:hypothetical protein